jgi:hypothetical protein
LDLGYCWSIRQDIKTNGTEKKSYMAETMNPVQSPDDSTKITNKMIFKTKGANMERIF